MPGGSIHALSGLLRGADIPSSASGIIAVDLDALATNYAKLRERAGAAECAAVVKGDGYGVGAVATASALATKGCRTFFVATLSEAESLRIALPNSTIFVLDGLFPGTAADFAHLGICPVLGDPGEIEEWSDFCRAGGQKLPAALHIDTGMNRLGLKESGQRFLLSNVALLDSFTVSLIMSHLACADTPDHVKNRHQRAVFAELAGKLPSGRLSLANSAGIFLGPDFCFDLVRPGIALYGGNPFHNLPNPMEPVVSLYGRVVQTGEAKAGETVGYGAAMQLKRPTRYATVAIGYADGYLRALGSTGGKSGATAFFQSRPLPILGRVSMDLVVFDISDLPPDKIRRGGFVELLGPSFTVDDAAALAGTIGYEILTSLGPRYTRIYLGGNGGAG